jgi:hypothetical protein
MPQEASQGVKYGKRARITDVGEIIHGGATDIHADLVRVQGGENFFRLRQRIVKNKSHMSAFMFIF